MLDEALEHLGTVARARLPEVDDVRVRSRDLRRGQVLEVRVHPDDIGKVIGRNGRTAKALRAVMTAVGGRNVRVDLLDSLRPR